MASRCCGVPHWYVTATKRDRALPRRDANHMGRQGTGDRCDRRDPIAEFEAESVAHYGPVGDARGADPARIAVGYPGRIIDQAADESDIVYLRQACCGVAAAVVPCPPVAVGVDGQRSPCGPRGR
jgi:hypothetical protein